MAEAKDDDVVTRLGSSREKGQAPFLLPHHLAAATRFERLVAQSQVRQRVTMSYSPTTVGGDKGAANHVETASDGAADARLRLSRLAASLPADCWGVLFDVCALGKGLQLVETERRWPRRSAKLVLRIGLEHLAAQFGLSAKAEGSAKPSSRGWLEQRLPLIADRAPEIP